VKGWGKSPPHSWRQGWQGKPRLEQDRIGTDARKLAGALSRSVRVGRARRSARAVPEEWSPRGRKALDRTRLTGRPIEIFSICCGQVCSGQGARQAPDLTGVRGAEFTGRKPLIHNPDDIAHRSSGFVPFAEVPKVNGGLRSRCFPYSPMVSLKLPRMGLRGGTVWGAIPSGNSA